VQIIETVKYRQGILQVGMDLCEFFCWLDVICQFIRAGRINMIKNLSMMERKKFFEVSRAAMQWVLSYQFTPSHSKFLCLGVTLLPTRMDGSVVLYIQPLAFTFLRCSLVFQFYTIVIDV
jgi:hypothetical protein